MPRGVWELLPTVLDGSVAVAFAVDPNTLGITRPNKDLMAGMLVHKMPTSTSMMDQYPPSHQSPMMCQKSSFQEEWWTYMLDCMWSQN